MFTVGESTMGAKIRHIAIATQDPEKIATFFKQALGLQQVGVANSDLATGYFLTDGNAARYTTMTTCLTLLPVRISHSADWVNRLPPPTRSRAECIAVNLGG
jgi:catechol 2,3-dioxygenase-like lactoylglutathione lyase family enzyme